MSDAEPADKHQLSTMSGMSGASSSNGVLSAKLARRKLQQDVELLNSRVERLRQEERKAKQKVLETKLRGQEITALQKRNEQASTAKMLARKMEEDQRLREMQQVVCPGLPPGLPCRWPLPCPAHTRYCTRMHHRPLAVAQAPQAPSQPPLIPLFVDSNA